MSPTCTKKTSVAIQKNKTGHPIDDPQIPQPDLRFALQKNRQNNNRTGPGPNTHTKTATEALVFVCPSPLPFGGSTVLSLTRGPAGNREPPPAVCQRHKRAAIPTAPRGRLTATEATGGGTTTQCHKIQTNKIKRIKGFGSDYSQKK